MIGYIVTPVTPDNPGLRVLDADSAADLATAINKRHAGRVASVHAIDMSSDPRVAKLEEIADAVDRLVSNYSTFAALTFVTKASLLMTQLDELRST